MCCVKFGLKSTIMNEKFLLLFLVFILDHGICEEKTIDSNRTPKENNIKYYTKPADTITIPIMIHFDKSLPISLRIKKSKIPDRLKSIARHILNDIESIFKHPSLNQTINFELLDVKIIRNNTKRKMMDANVSRYLKSYCRWQGEKKKAKETWYYSVLFTGLDLFYVNGNREAVRSRTGLSYHRGLCSDKHSCTLLEWHPKSMGYLLAHEIAHSLGIYHDGAPYNECSGKQHIMGASFNPHKPVKGWSSCNKRDLKTFLESKYGWCL